jgi:thioredoxin reductase (NADPH)
MAEQNQIYDTVIIGSGAAAYGAALYAARYMLRTALVGDPAHFGGDTAIGSIFENFPGYTSIDGLELMGKFREQATKAGAELVDGPMKQVTREGDRFRVELANGSNMTAKTVIVATGRRRRHLGLEHEDELVGKGVAYCAICDAPLYPGKTVAIAGGGDSAAKGALLLSQYAAKVYLIFRSPELTRPEPVNVSRLKSNNKVELVPGTNVTGLVADGFLKSVKLDKPYEGKDELPLDALFIEIGADPEVAGLESLSLTRNEGGEIVRDELGTTSCPGVFAAGDVTDVPLKQTIVAVTAGVMAATGVHEYLGKQQPATPTPQPATVQANTVE